MCKSFFLLCLLLSFKAGAANTDPYAQWVPPGWTLIRSVAGDLDNDGKRDAVLVIEQADPAKRRENDQLGVPTLNLNPRKLVVLLQAASAFRKVAEVERFIPSENDAESTCLDDPLREGGVSIARGLLRIELHYWMSCGSYGVTHRTFSFRYDGGRFRLVGADVREFMRNSGARTETSVNYLTGREKRVSGLNEFEPPTPRTSWRNIPSKKRLYLDEMDPHCDSEATLGEWCE